MFPDLDDPTRRALAAVLVATAPPIDRAELARHLKYLHDQKDHGRRGPAALAKLVTDAPGTSMPMADLLDADAATKDSALRAVYEGSFGNLHTKVTRTTGGSGTMGVEGTIHDRKGRKVGHFSRSIERGSGEVYAEHGVVQIERRVQGSGFAAAFNGAAIDWYRRSGVDAVYLNAQGDVGGYAWASQGFDFADLGGATTTIDELRDVVASLRAGRAKNQYGEPISRKVRNAPDLDAQLAAAEALLARAESSKLGEPGYPSAYEISQLGRRPGQGRNDMWLGKDIMLGSAWQGVLPLTGGTDATG